LNLLNPFFNSSPTAGSGKGTKRTEEFKKNRSIDYKGRVNKGIHRSKETKKILSDLRLGSTLSIKTIIKIKNGNKLNPVHKKKNIYHFFNEKYGSQICTMFELRVKYDLKKSMLSQLCSGQLKKSQGWIIIN